MVQRGLQNPRLLATDGMRQPVLEAAGVSAAGSLLNPEGDRAGILPAIVTPNRSVEIVGAADGPRSVRRRRREVGHTHPCKRDAEREPDRRVAADGPRHLPGGAAILSTYPTEGIGAGGPPLAWDSYLDQPPGQPCGGRLTLSAGTFPPEPGDAAAYRLDGPKHDAPRLR